MISYDDWCDMANPSPVSCETCKEDIENCECGEGPPEEPEDTFDLDPTCPVCKAWHGAADVFDGSERHCENCDQVLVSVTYTDGTGYMQLYGSDANRLARARTSRQRTRARWRKRGRR